MVEGKNVVVTGGAGFLGSRITARLLELGCAHVAIVGRSQRPPPSLSAAEFRQCDLKDAASVAAALRGADVVFHCAAKAGVWGAWGDYHNANVIGTRNVIAACRSNGVQALVHTSSPSAVCPSGGDAHSGADSREGVHCNYSKSKAMAEREVMEASKSGLIATVIRPPLIWGPGDPHLLPRVVERARHGKLIRVGDGTNLVDLTYIDNAAEAHILAAQRLLEDRRPLGKAYFISDGAPVNLWEWIDGLLERLGIPKVAKSISFKKAWAIGAILEIIYNALPFLGEPPMTRFVATQLSHSRHFDISPAQADFGYAPVIPPDIAMAKTVEYLKKQT